MAQLPGYGECCTAIGVGVRCGWEPDSVGVVLRPLQPSRVGQPCRHTQPTHA